MVTNKILTQGRESSPAAALVGAEVELSAERGYWSYILMSVWEGAAEVCTTQLVFPSDALVLSQVKGDGNNKHVLRGQFRNSVPLACLVVEFSRVQVSRFLYVVLSNSFRSAL